MSVLLLNPPNPNGFQANRDYMGNYGMINTKPGVVLPPLHLIQMGGTVEAENVHFLDASSEDLSWDETKNRILTRKPDVSIVLTSTPTFDDDCNVARWLKTETKGPVYLYGPQPAHVAKEAFEKSGADGILVGYTPSTLQTLMNSSSAPDLPELIRPDFIPTPPPVAPNFNMDDLPFGCWSLTPIEKYRFHVSEPTPFASMRSSLGCVYSCAYCPYVLAEGQRFLPMSPERIYSEMEYLSKEFGVRYILFRDLLFTVQKKRIEQLCELLISKPLPLTWRCETSTQHLSKELIEALGQARCTGLNLGVESVDEPSAEEMDLVAKRRNLEQLRDVFGWAKKAGIKTNALFVIGFPEDSREGVQRTVNFAKTLDAETFQFSVAMPYPGTSLETIAKKENLIEEKEWSEFSSLKPVMRTRTLSRDDVQELVRKALRSVYFRPGKLAKMATNPLDFFRRAQAFLRFYVSH